MKQSAISRPSAQESVAQAPSPVQQLKDLVLEFIREAGVAQFCAIADGSGVTDGAELDRCLQDLKAEGKIANRGGGWWKATDLGGTPVASAAMLKINLRIDGTSAIDSVPVHVDAEYHSPLLTYLEGQIRNAVEYFDRHKDRIVADIKKQVGAEEPKL